MKKIFENWKRHLNEQDSSSRAKVIAAKKFDENYIDLVYYYIKKFAPGYIKSSPSINSINWTDGLPIDSSEISRRGELQAFYLLKLHNFHLELLPTIRMQGYKLSLGKEAKVLKQLISMPKAVQAAGSYKESWQQVFIDKNGSIPFSKNDVVDSVSKIVSKYQTRLKAAGAGDEASILNDISELMVNYSAINGASVVVHEIAHKIDLEDTRAGTGQLIKYYEETFESSLKKAVEDINAVGADQFTKEDIRILYSDINEKADKILNQLQYQTEEFAYNTQLAFLNRAMAEASQNKQRYSLIFTPESYIGFFVKKYQGFKKSQLSVLNREAGLPSGQRKFSAPKKPKQKQAAKKSKQSQGSRSRQNRRPASVQRRLDVMDRT